MRKQYLLSEIIIHTYTRICDQDDNIYGKYLLIFQMFQSCRQDLDSLFAGHEWIITTGMMYISKLYLCVILLFCFILGYMLRLLITYQIPMCHVKQTQDTDYPTTRPWLEGLDTKEKGQFSEDKEQHLSSERNTSPGDNSCSFISAYMAS